MLIVGGDFMTDGAGYDPATDTWRPLPDVPIRVFGGDDPQLTSAVWTGEELVVW